MACFSISANNGAAAGGNCRRARAVCVQRWAAHFAVGLARFFSF
jgi:hypothetical protein